MFIFRNNELLKRFIYGRISVPTNISLTGLRTMYKKKASQDIFKGEDTMSYHYNPSLDYFIVIIEHMSLTKAANELHVSQQNLSIYLKRLEQNYRIKLFERRPNLQLTEAGQLLKNAALQIHSIYQDVDTQMEHLRSAKQRIRLGCSHGKIDDLMSYLPMSSYQNKFPNVEIKIIESSSLELEKLLILGSIDLYIGNGNTTQPNLDLFLLAKCPYYVTISSHLLKKYWGEDYLHTIAVWEEQGVDLKYFADIPHIACPKGHLRKIIDEYQLAAGFSLRNIAENSNPNLRLQMCKYNLGFTVSENIIPNYREIGLYSFPITTPVMELPLSCVRRKNEQPSAHLAALWKQIQQMNQQECVV